MTMCTTTIAFLGAERLPLLLCGQFIPQETAVKSIDKLEFRCNHVIGSKQGKNDIINYCMSRKKQKQMPRKLLL